MSILSFDFETALIRPGVQAPEAACVTWQTPGASAQILHALHAEPQMRAWLEDDSLLLAGANTPFDLGVTCANWPWLTDLVWRKYEANLVSDVQIREKLLDIAAGRYQGYHTKSGGWVKPRYALSEIAGKYGMQLDKPQSVKDPITGKMVADPEHVRLRFGELIEHAVEDWDQIAHERRFHGPSPTVYAKEDAVATLVCHAHEEPHAAEFLQLESIFCQRAWAIDLISKWGVRTDAGRVIALIEKAEKERQRIQGWLMEQGLVRENGSRDTKVASSLMRRVCREAGLKVPLTKTGTDKQKTRGLTEEEIEDKYTCLDEDACKATEDPLLKSYAAFTKLGATITKDGAALAKGTRYPIHTRFDMAATGRTTSSKPNMQNFGRDVGPRECFVARPGKVIAQADYEALELRTLAQVCVSLFGKSKLADALNAGRDPHLQMAADMLGITYELAKTWRKAKGSPEYAKVDDARQTGKVANFGFPGGLGAEKLVLWGRKTYNVILTVERARELKQDWLRSWPEMDEYFKYINMLCEQGGGLADVKVPVSGFLRGAAPYCAACNTNFQSLGASAAGRGVWYVQRANYHDRSSVLFGSRTVNFVHDEMLVEVDDDNLAHEKAIELETLMCRGANEFLPDVTATAPPMLMRWWSKSAFALKGPDGRLIPWAGEAA